MQIIGKKFLKKYAKKAIKQFKHIGQMNNFKKSFHLFKELDNSKRFEISYADVFPCLNDNTTNTNFDAHYIYHPAWAARIVKDINPDFHVDISSTLHFCTILSAFIPVHFYDFRPAELKLNNLQSNHADLTNLHLEENSIKSLSCMHTIEHIGLGRYGDPIDPDGDLKAINELKRVCAIGGNLLLVVPVGKQRIMFNAHRIYNPHTFISYLNGFSLKEFSLIADDNSFVNDADLDLAASQTYGCGCFLFVKN